MDIFWIILDSLSFGSTPFSSEGLDSMPKLSALADDQGLIFRDAYAPGPKSPSSHGSFFTGELPSRTGMHEAHPSFDADLPTIADALSETHRSYLVSSNPFLFNGLHTQFDETKFINDRSHLLFDSATDPKQFKWKRGYDSLRERYVDFLFERGKPIRSLLNGLNYKVQNIIGDGSPIPSQTERDLIEYQSVETMNENVRSFLEAGRSDSFVVANYMDIHPPLNASEAALEKFAPDVDISEFPVGVSGQRLQKFVRCSSDNRVMDLYHAAIWDLDRKLAPLLSELVANDAFIVVTADHGNWFRPDTGLDDEKLHVPLILFHPNSQSGVVDETVNLIQLPRTTVQMTDPDNPNPFDGTSLTEENPSQVSLTEHIRAAGGGPVNPYGDDHEVRHDVFGVKSGTQVHYRRGEYERLTETATHEKEIRDRIDAIISTMSDDDREPLNYDESTEQRLKELGYL